MLKLCKSYIPLITFLFLELAVASPAGPPVINSLTTPLHDLEATMVAQKINPEALKQIDPEFARNYALHNLLLLYKAPDMIRLDGVSKIFGRATLILNGSVRFYVVPKLHLHNVENLSEKPVLRQSLLEYAGLLTPETFAFMSSKPLGVEQTKEGSNYLYKLSYNGTEPGSFYKVWVDSKTHVVVKRDWYGRDGALKASYDCSKIKEVGPSLWIPTRMEVFDSKDASAAVTELTDIKVNQGLSNALFTVGK